MYFDSIVSTKCFILIGKILTVETLRIKYTDTWQSNYLDPDDSHYSDNAKASKLYLEILRVYYVRGPPCYESIGKCPFEFFTIGKSVRFDRNKKQFLGIII